MTLKEAVSVLTKHLKEDENYRMTWRANIAMAFQDEYTRHQDEPSGQKASIHEISNKAAENFLDVLCMHVVFKSSDSR